MITISQLLSQTKNILFAHYRTYGVYLLLLIAPTIFFVLLQQIFVDVDPSTAEALINTKNIGIGIITQAIISLAVLWVTIAIIYTTNTLLMTGQSTSIQQETSKATRMLLPTFLLSIIISAISFVSFLLLIIPGVIVTIWFAFSYHTYLLEHTTILQSLKRSKALVRGKFWNIFWKFAVIGIISVAIIFILTIIPTIALPFLNLDVLIEYIGLIASSVSALYIIVAITILYKAIIAMPAQPTTPPPTE